MSDAVDHTAVMRAEIARLERRLDALVDEFRKERDVQLTRIAQIQADIDMIRATWSKPSPR
jgi:hypothetical protein